MATTKKTTAGSKTTAVAKWDEALAARAKLANKAVQNIGGGGQFISLKGGVMSYNDAPVDDNELDVIIPSFVLENQYYVGKYNPKVQQAPVCYAFGTDEDEMVPHEKSPDPQADRCSECPHNEWGSDPEGGRGKACKNVARLAILPADCLEEGAEGVRSAQEAFVKVPVTSMKNWAGHVKKLDASNLPPLAFVTTMSLVPDAKSQFQLTFHAKDRIEDGEAIGAVLERADELDKTIDFPYQEVDQEAAPRGRGNARAASRAPAKTAAKPAASKTKAAPAAAAKTAGGKRKF